jgi:hypothetical protein
MASFSHYRVTTLEQTPILSESSMGNLDELKIKVLTLSENEIVFDLIGVDPSVANALRRILLAEVYTIFYQ